MEPQPVKRSAGRPPSGDSAMTRVCVYLDAATIAKAQALASGNLSAGLRVAVAQATATGS